MPKSFYVIDGHAHIYRAYFAPFRDLTSPTGEPTKATFVFTQMLLNLISQRQPDYLCMVIDSGDETVFRKEIFSDYKANRKERPDDFGPQEQRILEIVRDAGVPIFAKPGYEADDLIATIARQLCDEDYEIFVVSKDKDLRQIVNPCTKMYDVQNDKVIDLAAMEQELGYTPAEAIEIQTLTGDAIDNVPGIPGVGEKTALKLVKKYGSADAVLNHLDELTPKMRENFEKYAERLAVARKLVTLKDDVEFDFDVDACRFVGLDQNALRSHMRALGFTSLLKRLGAEDDVDEAPIRSAPLPRSPLGRFEESLFGPDPEAGQSNPLTEPATGSGCRYELVQTDEQFEAFLQDLKKQKRFAFDTETDQLGPTSARLVGLSFSWQHSTGYYVPVCGPSGAQFLNCQRVLPALRPILEDPQVKKVGHNLKYDLLVMKQVGVEIRGVEMDSMIAAFLLDASRMQYGIDRLALDLLNFRKVPTSDLIGKGRRQLTMDRVELNRIACYAAEDADVALRLADYMSERLDAMPVLRKLNDELETPLIDVLVEMEHNGISIDPAILKEQSAVLAGRIDEMRQIVYDDAGREFNIDSPKQLEQILFVEMNLPRGKRTKTGYSTDVQVLDRLASKYPIAQHIKNYREVVKLKNTYLDSLTDYQSPADGRIHASFNQAGASTGRLSCSDPNLQNIPIRRDEGRRIRLAFVPGDREKNVLLTADYSQIELRILAHLTQEPALLKAFSEDEDIHRAVAAEVFSVAPDQVSREQRGFAKTINFGIVYGVSAMGLANRIEGLTVRAAGDLITQYHRRFPGIAKFLRECVRQAQEKGYVETMMGRRRPIPDINSSVLSQSRASERMAINSVVQGSAADLIKQAMLNVFRRIRRENHPSKLLLQVHDELVFETPADRVEDQAAMVRQEMTTAMELTVPLKVEVGWGKNWQEVK
ncbi:MAG TPA: DNA polymerase I [Tepidisphaeraceae bacterium]|jgi:DNA polymerase-1|nr:DNA polymerase I [Tepidisphaeraceae bacterium]